MNKKGKNTVLSKYSPVTVARIHAFQVVADFKPNFQPIFYRILIDFTD